MALAQVSQTVKIFFSLAHAPEDRTLFEKLRKHLSALQRQSIINILYDSEIKAGENVDSAIKSFIEQADIAVLLISSDFLASHQCYDIEMQYALERRKVDATPLISVLLRPVLLSGLSLEEDRFLPSDGRAVSLWQNLDSALLEVARGIHQVVETIAHHLLGSSRPVKPPQLPLYLPMHRPNPFFTDRQNTLSELHQYFIAEQTELTCIQALYGLPGIGKTLLAAKYTTLYKHEYQDVLWLNGTPPDLFSSNVLSLAARLGIPAQQDVDELQRLETIKRWLQDHDRWLLVIDNLEDVSLLDQLVPDQSTGHVLVIPSPQAAGMFPRAISIDPMTIEDGALLLLRRAQLIPQQGSLTDTSEENYQQALAIAQEVEGHPLALDQVGAYIHESKCTLAWYHNLYRDHKAELLGRRGLRVDNHPASVRTALELIFKKLGEVHPRARDLLSFFAFLYHNALPREMIRDGASVLTGTLRALALKPLDLDEAIGTLANYSLVHASTDSTLLRMQQIVQFVLKQQLKPKERQQLAMQAVRLVNAIFPAVLIMTREGCERYLPQAVHCATLIQEFQLTLEEGGLLLERVGSYYYQLGCYREAEKYLTQALQLQEHQRRGDPLDIAQTLNSLGLLYQRQARDQEAEALHWRALEIRERAGDDLKIAESLHNLAISYEQNEQYQQAEVFYLRALALDEGTSGANQLEIARTLNNLAMLYYLQEQHDQAEITYQRALTTYQRSTPPDHPDRAYSLNGLGAVYEKRGDYQHAERLYRQALAIREEQLGGEHPETAHSFNKVADILETLGHYEEAELLYQRALTIGEQALGPNHPDVALFLNNLAFLLVKQGRYEQATSLYLRALFIYKQTLGPNHRYTALVREKLEQLEQKRGNGTELAREDNETG